MATIFESLTDAEIEAMLAELENQQAAEAILADQAPEVLSVEADTGTTGGQVATDLGQIPTRQLPVAPALSSPGSPIQIAAANRSLPAVVQARLVV